MFGDAYVIPMFDVLQDIKSRLNATEVDLPQTVDILTSPQFVPITEQVDSSVKMPTTPGPDSDSGYATLFCSPAKTSLSRAYPKNEDIHASIRASLPDKYYYTTLPEEEPGHTDQS
jgi:hypothetical protein